MNNITNFIHTKQIDSFQKLRVLLFLQQHPEIEGTCQELAERLYLGDTLLVQEIVHDLQKADLLVSVEHRWKLSDEPEVKTSLQHLTRGFENPLVRQELLAQVKQFVS